MSSLRPPYGTTYWEWYCAPRLSRAVALARSPWYCPECSLRKPAHRFACTRRPPAPPVVRPPGMRYRPTKWAATLPASAFPFRMEYLESATGRVFERIDVREPISTLFMPLFPQGTGEIVARIEWPDGTTDEQLGVWSECAPGWPDSASEGR